MTGKELMGEGKKRKEKVGGEHEREEDKQVMGREREDSMFLPQEGVTDWTKDRQ